jgi:hypothetical protein
MLIYYKINMTKDKRKDNSAPTKMTKEVLQKLEA